MAMAGAWVAAQMDVPPTLLRAHVRARTNPMVLHDASAGGATGVCDDEARWDRHTFNTQDIGKVFEVHADSARGLFVIKAGDVMRTSGKQLLAAEWPPSCKCLPDSRCESSGGHHTEWCYVKSFLACSDAMQSQSQSQLTVWSEKACAPTPGAPNPVLLKTGAECDGSHGELYLGVQTTLVACVQRCRDYEGCNYFLFGTGSKFGRCYKEGDFGDDCSLNDGGGYKAGSYDYYKLGGSGNVGGNRTRTRTLRQEGAPTPRNVVIEQANVAGTFGQLLTP